MDDRKLLELAAKAAGLYEDWPEPDYGMQWNGDGLWCFGMGEGMLWNPLTDDGDALRLAVKLELQIDARHSLHEIRVYGGPQVVDEASRDDPCAALRRAIVRAAASIGEQEGK